MSHEDRFIIALQGALSDYDKKSGQCPIMRSPKFLPICPLCGADKDGHCGAEASANYTLVKTLRAELAKVAALEPEQPK
jgi:hypothetical protein